MKVSLSEFTALFAEIVLHKYEISFTSALLLGLNALAD